MDNVRFAGTHLFGENPSDAYTGRRVVAEVIEPDQRFMDFIKEERKPEAVNYWKEHLNGLSMLEHAFALVCLGELDIREMEDKVGRVIDIDPERIPRIIELATREF